VSKKKKCHFLQSLQNQNALLHAFARFFAEATMVEVVVVGGGVDIAVDDNGVLTLGEWLFACVARSLVRSCIRLFVCSFVRSFIFSFVGSLMLLLVVVVISL
jgi:hypothetical protein